MSDDSYAAACAEVVEAFVAAYPDFLRSRLEAIAPDAAVDEGVRQGAEWLRAELTQWASLAGSEQKRGPLQIFQTSFAFVTAALEAAGVAAPSRDPAAVQALPGDIYDLAPASSRDIGEAAWRAHVTWGVAKAWSVAEVVPRDTAGVASAVAVVTMDSADRAAVRLVAAGRGVAAHHWRNPGAIAAGLEEIIPRWAVVDAEHRAADEAVRMLTDASSKVAVYGPEPDDIAMARWLALGAATVVPRARLIAVLESWLPLQA